MNRLQEVFLTLWRAKKTKTKNYLTRIEIYCFTATLKYMNAIELYKLQKLRTNLEVGLTALSEG